MRIDRLFHRETVARLVSILMLFGLLGLADGYLLVIAARRYGVYLALALEAATALLALAIVGTSVRSKLRRIRRHISFGTAPGLLYGETLVLMVSLALLIAPGFVSDALGIILFVIPVRTGVAWLVYKFWGAALAEAHEYVKMRAFSDRS